MGALNARSVVLSTLLGTDPPEMPVQALLRVTDLFDLSRGTVRTALTRMVQRGELTTDGAGRYRLAGSLLVRQRRQHESRAAERVPWSGAWRLAVVGSDARSAADRALLRSSMGALRFAELREGTWLRPDNLAADRLGEPRRFVEAQCRWFTAHPGEDDAQLAARLWALREWSAAATELRRAMAALARRLDRGDTGALAEGFVLSAGVLRHLQADPLLPDELLPRRWAGVALRRDYVHYDDAYRRLLRRWLVSEDGGR